MKNDESEYNRFVIIMPCYNAQDTIVRSILSIVAQSYSNWKILIRDDMSTDNTRQIIDGIIKVFGLQDKVLTKTNTEKKWEVANILSMLDECENNDIICRYRS